MSNHHNHPTHVHNFFNKHTAFAILVIIVGCFLAGYFVGKNSSGNYYGKNGYRNHMDRSENYMGGKNVEYRVR